MGFLAKKIIGWMRRQNGLLLFMWVVVFPLFLVALFCVGASPFYDGWLTALVFSVLWLPIRWDNQMRPEQRSKSWAEKNVIHT
jgi:hypothetical protein